MNEILEKLVVAWLIMWGLSYIFTALMAPWIAGMGFQGGLLYCVLGALILFALLCNYLAHDELGYTVVSILFIILGMVMVYSGVASWTGLVIWNIPFSNIEIFQVSMAFANLLSAVFMFVMAITSKQK